MTGEFAEWVLSHIDKSYPVIFALFSLYALKKPREFKSILILSLIFLASYSARHFVAMTLWSVENAYKIWDLVWIAFDILTVISIFLIFTFVNTRQLFYEKYIYIAFLASILLHAIMHIDRVIIDNDFNLFWVVYSVGINVVNVSVVAFMLFETLKEKKKKWILSLS